MNEHTLTLSHLRISKMKCQIKKRIKKNSHKTKQFQETSFKAFYVELQNILQRKQRFLCGSKLFTTQNLPSAYILPMEQ